MSWWRVQLNDVGNLAGCSLRLLEEPPDGCKG